MLLLKKFCRFNGHGNRQRNVGLERRTNEDLTEDGNVAANTVPSRSEECHNRQQLHEQQRPQHHRRHTPPPLYHSLLPSTPPPSYTAPDNNRCDITNGFRSVNDSSNKRPNPEVPPQLSAHGRHQTISVVVAHGPERRLLCSDHLNPPGNLPVDRQHLQQATRRRQRLQSLQRRQPDFSILRTRTTDDSSSSSSDSDNRVTGPQRRSGRQRRRRQQRSRSCRGLRDVYCPDILNACSLILQQQQWRTSVNSNSKIDETSDSTVGSFTDSLANGNTSDDYAVIAEIPNKNVELLRDKIDASGQLNIGTTHENPTSTNQRELDHREMGQNLSLRRPRISLTWVLREQQQQQTHDNTESQDPTHTQLHTNGKEEKDKEKAASGENEESSNNNNGLLPHNGYDAITINAALLSSCTTAIATATTTAITTSSATNTTTTSTTTSTTKKRYRLKQLPVSADPLNGYATTPTAGIGPTTTIGMPAQKFFSNQNLLEYRGDLRDNKQRPPTKELFFVCTPQRLPISMMQGSTTWKNGTYDTSDALALAKKRNEIRKRLAALHSTQHQHPQQNSHQQNKRVGDGAEMPTPEKSIPPLASCKDDYKSLKGTYSEPSLIAASEGVHHRRHRHRKRRERQRNVPKFGYEIANVEEFLSKCSLASPANIPVVLASSTTLYQTRPGGYQVEIALPLGMVVNAVFKNQNWLYVQTPHAEEGYVGYKFCLPLGILPTASSTKPQPCWESNGDVFPRPCGNMTDSEKEIHLRGGTRSDGARTPRGGPSMLDGAKTFTHNPIATTTTTADALNGNAAKVLLYGEHQVDKLYLRAASQAQIVEKTAAYAQLRSTRQTVQANSVGANDEYVTLQHQQQQQLQHRVQQKSKKYGQNPKHSFVTNDQNGQHFHPHPHGSLSVRAHPVVAAAVASTATIPNSGVVSTRGKHGLRQTLVAINADYRTDSICLQKGEIVTLCECRISKDNQQWFYVRTRDGREGYIPAEVAGHGFL